MSAVRRQWSRAVFEMVCNIGGWGLCIAGVVSFFTGNPVTGFWLLGGAVTGWALAAISFRTSPPPHVR